MNNLKKIDSDTLLSAAVSFTVVCVFCACIAGFYNEIVYQRILLGYCDILVFATMGVLFCNGMYFANKRYFAYVTFLCWVAVTFMLRGEFDLTMPVNRSHFVILCASCGVLLPMPAILKGNKKRILLDSVLFSVSLLMCVFLILAYIGLIRGENLALFHGKLTFGATYTYTQRMMLKVLNLHYYYTGLYSAVLFFCTLYLAFSHWKGWLKLLWVFMLATLATGVFITYSRTAVLSFTAGILLTLYFCFFRNIKSRKIKWRACVLSAVGGVSAVAVAMNRIYSAVNSIRDVWYGITTLSSRTVIWASLIPLVKDYPLVILRGLPLSSAMDAVKLYIPDQGHTPHMHNSYLQTFLHLGLPGLIAIIFFMIYLLKCIKKLVEAKVHATDRQLCIVPVVIMLIGVTESNFICNPCGYEMMNLIFALASGFIIEKAESGRCRTDCIHCIEESEK